MTGIYIGTSPLKEAYVGTTPIKEIYVGTTKVRPEEIFSYDNIYVFFDGIYTGTDSSPKTTKLYSDSTIRACFFDRETKVLWLGKTNGIGYYSFKSNSYTSVVSETITYELNAESGFVFLENYLLFRGASSNGKYYVINRKNKTLSRTISYDTTNYSGVDMGMCYDYNYDYRCRNQGYKQSKVVDLTTGNDGSNIFTTSYHGCRMFNGKFYISCENGSNNGRVYSTDGSYVQVTSGSNMGYGGIVFLADSGHITKVTSSDYEYDRIVLGPTRNSTASKIIKGGTTLESNYTGAEHGNFIKYNDDYSIIQFDYDQKDSYNFGFALRKKSDGTLTRHSFGLSERRNLTTCASITQTGNLGFYRIGIFDISGNNIYSSDEFVGCISKDVFPSNNDNVYYSNKNYQEYQSLVNSTGSIQFADSGKRFRFYFGVYIGNRTALDFQQNSNVMRIINLDTLTSTSKTLSVTMPNRFFRVWYFGNGRILTPKGILDFQGNIITSFSYDSITPGAPGVVWANSGFNIYKGIVNGDNITFTKIGTSGTDQGSGDMAYGQLGAYLLNSNDTTGSGYSAYVNVSNNSITNFTGGQSSRNTLAVAGPDGKLYRKCIRYNDRGKLQKIGTGSEGFVGDALSTNWMAHGTRFGKFLGNVVSGGMSSSNGTGNGYGSNNYFITTNGTFSKVQTNAWAYDSDIYGYFGFIDEKGYIYPYTGGGGTGVILKTNKTFTDLNWKNPYLWR